MLLINAVKSGHICQIKHFLKAGIDVNLTDKNGHTAVIHCCFLKDEEKRMKIFKILLHEDVDVNRQDQQGRSLLSWISFQGRTKMFTFLLDHFHRQFDFNVYDKKGNSLLMLAVLSKSLRMVALLLDVLKEFGFLEQVNHFNDLGMCPLIIAFQRKDHECARLLVKGKASISGVLRYLQCPINKKRYLENVTLPVRGQAFHTFMRAAKLDPKNAPKLPTEQELLEFIFSDSSDSKKETQRKTKARVLSAYALRKDLKLETKSSLRRRPLSSKAMLVDPGDLGRPSSLATVSMETITSPSRRILSPSFTGLYEIYSTQLSNSYRQGIHTPKPTPPSPPSVPDIPPPPPPKESDTRQRRTSLQRHSSNLSEKSTKAFSLSKRSSNLTSTSVLAPVEESPYDRQMRMKYARSSRATSVQVAKFPAQIPVMAKRRNRSTTISQL